MIKELLVFYTLCFVQVTSQEADCLFGTRIERCYHGCCARACCPSRGVPDKYYYMGGTLLMIILLIGCCMSWKVHKGVRERKRMLLRQANNAQLARTTDPSQNQQQAQSQKPMHQTTQEAQAIPGWRLQHELVMDGYLQPVPRRFEPLPSVQSLFQASEQQSSHPGGTQPEQPESSLVHWRHLED